MTPIRSGLARAGSIALVFCLGRSSRPPDAVAAETLPWQEYDSTSRIRDHQPAPSCVVVQAPAGDAVCAWSRSAAEAPLVDSVTRVQEPWPPPEDGSTPSGRRDLARATSQSLATFLTERPDWAALPVLIDPCDDARAQDLDLPPHGEGFISQSEGPTWSELHFDGTLFAPNQDWTGWRFSSWQDRCWTQPVRTGDGRDGSEEPIAASTLSARWWIPANELTALLRCGLLSQGG